MIRDIYLDPLWTDHEPSCQQRPIRIWVNDKHPIFRRGLVASLNTSELRVVGESADHRDIAEIDTDLDADVVVFGATTMTLAALDRLEPTVRRVAIVDDGDRSLVLEAARRGANAILGRADVTPAALVNAVRAVDAGATLLPDGLLPDLLERAASGRRQVAGGLTERELTVLRMLAEGDDTRAIAGTLSYSERTVKNVVHDLLTKLNCRNRAHAVALATRRGVI